MSGPCINAHVYRNGAKVPCHACGPPRMPSKATPGPWEWSLEEGHYGIGVSNDANSIASCWDSANAELIVRAVNAHEALVKATQGLLKLYSLYDEYLGKDGPLAIEEPAILSARAALRLLEDP